jgi:phage terminase large subunit-like protein
MSDTVKDYSKMSIAQKVADLPKEQQIEFLSRYTPEQQEALKYDWQFWGRPSQFAPITNWHILLACAGRGFGKTRMLAEWVREKALAKPGTIIGIVARTAADARDVITLGESGIMKVHAPSEMPTYKPSIRRIEWPNGSYALLFSADSPDQLRGFQCHYLVGDEVAAWPTKPDASGATAWSNAVVCARLALDDIHDPQILLATTPKRTAFMKEMIENSKDPNNKIVVVTGATTENTNLGRGYIDNLERAYKGNEDLYKQEIEGLMLDGVQGAVFTEDMLIDNRIEDPDDPPYTHLRVVAVDPTVAAEPRDECGIVVIGATQERDLSKRVAFVLDDLSLKAKPEHWALEVVKAAKKWDTKHIVVERNQGGDLVKSVILNIDPTLIIHTVVATKGKLKRAEPVVNAMSRGRVKIWNFLEKLEEQMVFWDPNQAGSDSPDRMDAMVWGVTALLIDPPYDLRVKQMKIITSAGRMIQSTRGSGKARGFTPKTKRT